MSFRHCSAWVLSLSLVACGGGGADTPMPSPTAVPQSPQSVSGLAAYGMALAHAQIIMKDRHGNVLTTQADAKGQWSIADVSSLTAPMVIQAKGTVGGVGHTFYSVPIGPVGPTSTANINPLTTALLAQAAGISPDVIFADPGRLASLDSAKLQAAQQKLRLALAGYLSALGIEAKRLDFIATAFTADHQGLDKLMDLVKVHAISVGEQMAITVDDTTTDTSVQIVPNEMPKELARPDPATLALDLAAIPSRLLQWNQLLKTKAGVDSAAFAAFWDEAYLDTAGSSADEITKLRKEYELDPGLALQASLVSVLGCKLKVCQVLLSLTDAKGVSRLSEKTYLKQGADGQWRFFGDQGRYGPDFAAGFFSLAEKRQSLYRSGAPAADYQQLIQLFVRHPFRDSIGCARFYAKGKADSGWKKYYEMNASATNPVMTRRWYNPSDEIINELNAKIDAGGALYRVETFANADCTGTSRYYDQSLTQRFYSEAGLVNIAFPDAIGLGENKVRFNAQGINYLRVTIESLKNKTTLADVEWKGEAIKALGGEVSVAKVQASLNGSSADWSDAVITRWYAEADHHISTAYTWSNSCSYLGVSLSALNSCLRSQTLAQTAW
ncbi:hypothetical protein ABHF33_10320 [Chitinibacter sp. FCG-7]|uniref:Lipoprotein n=1 Tax=Chitinibacter mangrovi TaxID=3153927 RepID=A0AAU7F6E9_9NEIS